MCIRMQATVHAESSAVKEPQSNLNYRSAKFILWNVT